MNPTVIGNRSHTRRAGRLDVGIHSVVGLVKVGQDAKDCEPVRSQDALVGAGGAGGEG